jgi:S-adenosylmethionine-diacylglycerol 3-amino-3-carboxypropyl transferase
LLFGITREDHRVEAELVEQYALQSLLTVCSSGDVAFSLSELYPHLSITVFDTNSHQLAHANRKISAVLSGDSSGLNVERFDQTGLNQEGEFEKLFHTFRDLFLRHVAEGHEIRSYFDPETEAFDREYIVNRWRSKPEVMTPFKRIFNDRILNEVFSEEATNYAEPESYISYFYNKILSGLMKADGHKNPFLQHIFLGYYLKNDLLPYFRLEVLPPVRFIHGSLLTIANLQEFDCISLSNIFDWSAPEIIQDHISHLRQMKSGSLVLYRQLNNHEDWSPYFGKDFREDRPFDRYWQKHDRSLFYDHFRLFIKT